MVNCSSGDAYPALAGKEQWSKLMLYNAGKGWSTEGCVRMPVLCKILQGRLRTDREPERSFYRRAGKRSRFAETDEAVVLFRVTAGGAAYLHQGQDARVNCSAQHSSLVAFQTCCGQVNVHMCLYGCVGARVSVVGSVRDYAAGQLLAFEDRADHEIGEICSRHL